MIPVTDITWFVTLNYWTHKYWFNLAYGQLRSLTASCQDGINTSSIIFYIQSVVSHRSTLYPMVLIRCACSALRMLKTRRWTKRSRNAIKLHFPAWRSWLNSLSVVMNTRVLCILTVYKQEELTLRWVYVTSFMAYTAPKKFFLAFSFEADRSTEKY